MTEARLQSKTLQLRDQMHPGWGSSSCSVAVALRVKVTHSIWLSYVSGLKDFERLQRQSLGDDCRSQQNLFDVTGNLPRPACSLLLALRKHTACKTATRRKIRSLRTSRGIPFTSVHYPDLVGGGGGGLN